MLGWYTNLKKAGPDSARTWLIALGGTLICFVCNGSNRADALLFKAMIDDDPDLSREDASWPFTLVGAAVIYAAPTAGFLTYHLSCRKTMFLGLIVAASGSFACYFSRNIVYISAFYGIIRGTGMAFTSTLIPGLINNNCERTRASAMGIYSCGTPLGGLVIPLIVNITLESYGIGVTFLVLSGITLCAIVSPLFLILEQENGDDRDVVPDKVASKTGSKGDGAKGHADEEASEKRRPDESAASESEPLLSGHDSKDRKKAGIVRGLKEVFSTQGFYLVITTNFAILFFLSAYNVTIVDYAQDKQVQPHLAVHMVTAYAASELAGRLMLGWIIDKKYVSGTTFLAASLLVTASAVLMLAFFNGLVELLSCAVVIGLGQGCLISSTKVMYADYVSKENMHLAVSFGRSIIHVLNLSRSPLIGLFRDRLGSYDQFFYLLSAFLYLSGLLWLLEGVRKRNLFICTRNRRPNAADTA